MGLAAGLGFMFAETNLALMSGAPLPAYVLPLVPGFERFIDRPGGSVVFHAGHPISTALVGMATGVGLRWVRRRGWSALPALVALLLVIFDHAMVNWKLSNRGLEGATQTAAGVIAFAKAPPGPSGSTA